MPTYSFRNKKTGEEWEEFMGIKEADNFLSENPDIERFISSAPSIVGGTGDRTKSDDGFKEVLSKISDAHPNSALAETHGKKDRRSVAVRDSLKRVKKKLGKSQND
mgnify:CR=1 FL=1|tara:strand:+ start:190 stop:507 length:318 start_codon:yes stop_codon:yes gene_type:complete